MASLHDSLQMGKGSPEELLGVNPEDVPCYVAETQPGDLVCFDVILRTCFLRFVRLRAVTPRNAQHRCKHSAFGGGPRRRMFTTNWYARTDQSAAVFGSPIRTGSEMPVSSTNSCTALADS